MATALFRGSLARQFAWAAATLAGVAVVLIATASWWWIDRLQRDATEALLLQDMELHAVQLNTTLTEFESRLGEFASSPLLTTALTDDAGRDIYVQPYLSNIKTIGSVPIELMFVDFQGQEIARNGDVSFKAAHLQWMRGRLAKGLRGATVMKEKDEEFLLAVEMIVYPRSNTVEGALLMKLPLGSLLLNPAYRVLTADDVPATQRIGKAVAPPALFDELGLKVARLQPLASVATLTVSPWMLLLAGIGLILPVVLVGKRLADRLTADLRDLEHFARSMTEKAFPRERAKTSGAAEVSSLAQSINQMLDRLHEHHSTEQGRSEAQLRLLATCISRLNDVVMITEAQPYDHPVPRILFVNDAFSRMTGYTNEEVIGKTPKLLQGPKTDRKELERIRRSMNSYEPFRTELLNYRKDGSEFWLELDVIPITAPSGEITNWVSVERDITDRKEAEAVRRSLEAQVRQSQKMEAIGTLAGGVAHDFNNILGAILGNVALARDDVGKGDAPWRPLEQIRRSAERARSLVNQILTFSRQHQQYQLEVQDIRPLVAETVELLRATVPARVKIEMEAGGEPVCSRVDAVAVQQVLMNLATNAWHAMNDHGGTVKVGVDVERLPAAGKTGRGFAPTLAEGLYAHLWVVDDGCGMDAEMQARIFEPFFTTKPVGSGTGLGLSVVHGIVQSHQGAIALQSTPGAGSAFHVYLPLSEACTAAPDGAATTARPPRQGQGERILYIDDDEVLVSVVAAILERAGYQVATAGGAQAGVELVRAQPAAFAIVITDYNMPESSGIDILRTLKDLVPGLPVILTSGYLPDDIRAAAITAGARAVLRKESIHDDLLPLLEAVLEPAAEALV